MDRQTYLLRHRMVLNQKMMFLVNNARRNGISKTGIATSPGAQHTNLCLGTYFIKVLPKAPTTFRTLNGSFFNFQAIASQVDYFGTQELPRVSAIWTNRTHWSRLLTALD